MLAEAEHSSVREPHPRTEGAQRSRKCGGVHYPMTVATICVRDRRISRPAMFAASNNVQRRHGRRTVEPEMATAAASLTKSCGRCHSIQQ